MLEPVGPLPPSVYWRRRCLALVAVVLVLALLTWGAVALATGSSDAADTAEPAGPRPASYAGPGAPAPSPDEAAGPAAGASGTGAGAGGAAARSVPPGGDPRNAAAAARLDPRAVPPLDPRAALAVPPGGENGPLLGAHGPLGTPSARTAPAPTVPAGAPPPGLPSPATPQPGAASGTTPTTLATAPDGTNPRARPSAPTDPRPPGPCADGAVRITARTDKPRYAPGEKPVLAIVVTNAGPVPCVRDLDAARQAVAVVRKPGDGLWSSNDCSPLHTDDVRTLAPGQAVSYTVRWSTRTSTPGCRGERDQVPAGAYQLLARLDRIVSDPVPFALG